MLFYPIKKYFFEYDIVKMAEHEVKKTTEELLEFSDFEIKK